MEDDGDVIHAVFEVGSRFNHSCVPNTNYFWKEKKGMMVWRSGVDLKEGDEVTISYGQDKATMKKWYGFECACEGCAIDEASAGLRKGTGSLPHIVDEREGGSAWEEFVDGMVRLKSKKGN